MPRSIDPAMSPISSVFTARCRKCETCRGFFYHHWLDRGVQEIERAERSLMLTLTFAPVWTRLPNGLREEVLPTSVTAYEEVRKYLRRIRRDNERRAKKLGIPRTSVRFMLVIERGDQRGRVHAHMVVCLKGPWLAQPEPRHFEMTTEPDAIDGPNCAHAIAEREVFNSLTARDASGEIEYPLGKWAKGWAKVKPILSDFAKTVGYCLSYCLKAPTEEHAAETLPGGRRLTASTFWGPGCPKPRNPVVWPDNSAATMTLAEWVALNRHLCGLDAPGTLQPSADGQSARSPSGQVVGPTCAGDIKSSPAKSARAPPAILRAIYEAWPKIAVHPNPVLNWRDAWHYLTTGEWPGPSRTQPAG